MLRALLARLTYWLQERLRLVHCVALPECPRHGHAFFRVVGRSGLVCTRCEWEGEWKR